MWRGNPCDRREISVSQLLEVQSQPGPVSQKARDEMAAVYELIFVEPFETGRE